MSPWSLSLLSDPDRDLWLPELLLELPPWPPLRYKYIVLNTYNVYYYYYSLVHEHCGTAPRTGMAKHGCRVVHVGGLGTCWCSPWSGSCCGCRLGWCLVELVELGSGRLCPGLSWGSWVCTLVTPTPLWVALIKGTHLWPGSLLMVSLCLELPAGSKIY